MVRCKFCGKELKTGFEDMYHDYYYCNCDGMSKYVRLRSEMISLKNAVDDKQKEIDELIQNSAYGKMLKEKLKMESNLREFEDCFIYENR